MKDIIPVIQLSETISGVRIDRINDQFVELVNSIMDEIAKAHRNNHYICILLEKGSANFFVDFQEVNLLPHTLFFLDPSQVKRVISFNQSDGWILFFDRKLVDNQSRVVLEDSSYRGPVLSITQQEREWFLEIFQLLYKTRFAYEMSSFHNPAIQALLTASICKIASVCQTRMKEDIKQHSKRGHVITKTFMRLVRDNFKEMKRPVEYAEMMNISLGYLNDTVKTLTGHTVSYSIQQEVMREAQRLLCYSNLSIKEIAGELGFDDAKYFSRLFSKISHQSPLRFRREYQME